MPSRALLQAWAAAALVLWTSSGLAAAPLRVTGTVREAGVISGTGVELYPAYESYAGALRRLTEKQAPVPLAKARVGTGDAYELLAPGKGCFRVVVRAEGHPPLEIPFLPLVDHLELPTAPLVRSLPAWGEEDGKPSPPWSLVEELPAMSARRIRIKVRDAGDQPVPQALVRWRGRPIAVTGPDGRLEIALPKDGSPLTVESREGEQARISAPVGAGNEVIPIRLEPPRRVLGQAMDAETRKPVPGALVWSGRPLTAAPVLAGKDGTFEISLPSWADGTLEGTAPAYEPAETRIAGKAPAERVVLPLPPAMLLFGEVVDPADRPIPGVLIVAYPPRIRDGVPELSSVRSSEDGRFVLRGLLPNATYWVTFARQGYARVTATLRTHPTGKTRLHRFVLPEGPAVAGRLVDEGGRPVAGAEVALSLQPADDSFEEKAEWPAVSGPDGRFGFERVSGGIFTLKAAHPDHADLHMPDIEIAGDKPKVDLGTFTLAAGGTLEGKVTGAGGKPVEGAEVEIRGYDSVRFPKRIVRTGPDGTFRARGLRPGERFRVEASLRGYAPGSYGPVQLPREAPVRIELRPLRPLSGRVASPEGSPVAGAEVRAIPDVRAHPTLGYVQGGTDAEGRFRLEGVPPEVVALRVSADGYLPREVYSEDEGGDLEGVTVVLERSRAVEARVLDAQGEPVAGATARAWDQSSFLTSCRTDVQGRCRLQARPGVSCWVSAQRQSFSAMSFAESEVSRVMLPPGTGETQVELYLPGGTEVSGRVLGADGRGIPGIEVHLQAMLGEFSTLYADADGSFLIPGVPDGKYRLSVWRGKDNAEVAVTVEGQPVRGVELRLGPEEPEATLSGRIQGIAPVDLPRAWIEAESTHAANRTGRIDSRGFYRIQGLSPGEWSLKAEAPNGEAQATIQILPDQTEATLDLEIQPYRTVSGRVLLDGEPLAGANVEVLNGDQRIGNTHSGDDGSFRFSFLDSPGPGTGLYRLRVLSDGLAITETSARIPEGEGAPPVEIQMKRMP